MLNQEFFISRRKCFGRMWAITQF